MVKSTGESWSCLLTGGEARDYFLSLSVYQLSAAVTSISECLRNVKLAASWSGNLCHFMDVPLQKG